MKKSKTKNREKPSSTTGGAADTVERNKQGLVDDELLTNAQLADAEAKARQTRQSLGRILVSSRYASEEQLARFIAKKTHLPYINLNDYAIDRRVLEVIPVATARRHKFIPLFKIENVITVAMADPVGIISIEDVAFSRRLSGGGGHRHSGEHSGGHRSMIWIRGFQKTTC